MLLRTAYVYLWLQEIVPEDVRRYWGNQTCWCRWGPRELIPRQGRVGLLGADPHGNRGGLKIKRQPFGEENSPHTAGEGNTSIARCRKRLERVPGNIHRVPRSRSRPGGSRVLTALGAIRACRDV